MIEEQTVFILGAGASHPYGLPTADELRTQICFNFVERIDMLLKSREISNKEERHEEAVEFTKAFFHSNDSIDFWLMKNKLFMNMGRHAIIYMILKGENEGDFGEKAPYPKEAWYKFLWRNLTIGFTKQEHYKSLSENKVDFITFNYDRSLEQRLYQNLGYGFYEISEKEIKYEINKINIIHVYGKIAPLDWQSKFESISYGADPGNRWLEKYRNNIKLINEAEESEEVKKAISLIKNAKRIFFLGFGYAPENLKILDIPNILNRNQKIYGTGYHLDDKEIEKIEKSIKPPQKPKEMVKFRNLYIEPVDCLTLLKKYL